MLVATVSPTRRRRELSLISRIEVILMLSTSPLMISFFTELRPQPNILAAVSMRQVNASSDNSTCAAGGGRVRDPGGRPRRRRGLRAWGLGIHNLLPTDATGVRRSGGRPRCVQRSGRWHVKQCASRPAGPLVRGTVYVISDQRIGQDSHVETVNLAEAKAHLSTLVERAAAGRPVRILRRGKAVAQITAIPRERKRIDPAALRAITERMPRQAEDAGTFIRAVRDGERY